MSDAQIFNASELKECLEDGIIGLPPPAALPHDDHNMPYFLIGYDAFAMRTYMMKPYDRRGLSHSQLIFNYRLSMARRIVENAFGILAARFQVLLRTMQQDPDVVQEIVEACVCLHNLMRMRYQGLHAGLTDMEDSEHNSIPGTWRQYAKMHEILQVV